MAFQVTDRSGNLVNTSLWDPGYHVSATLVPGATPTSIVQIQGSASAVIRLKFVKVMLRSGTAAGGQVYTLNRRSTAAATGTSAAPTIVKGDPSNPAPTAAVLHFTAFPTVGTLVGAVKTELLQTQATAADTAKDVVVWQWTDKGDQALVIRGASDFVTLDMSAALATGQTLQVVYQWEEGVN